MCTSRWVPHPKVEGFKNLPGNQTSISTSYRNKPAEFDYFARPPGSIPFPKVKEAPTAPTTAVLRVR